MWKLRWKCPFCGYGLKISIVILLLCGIPFIVMEEKYEGIGICIISIIVAILMPSYFWVNRLHLDDREKIASAKPLQWQPVTQQQLDKLRKSKPSFMERFIVLILTPTVFLGILGTFDRDFVLMLAVPVFLLTMFLCLYEKYMDALWSNPDDSVECAEIQIDHIYSIKETGRGQTVYRDYAVFYTPEGKFVLKYMYVNPQRKNYIQRRLYIVRFHGMYEYLDFIQ